MKRYFFLLLLLLLAVCCREDPDTLKGYIGKSALIYHHSDGGCNLIPTHYKEIDEIIIAGISPDGRMQFQYPSGYKVWEDSNHEFLEILSEQPETKVQKKYWGKRVLMQRWSPGRVWEDSICMVSPKGRFRLWTEGWVSWGKGAIVEMLDKPQKGEIP
jgi:hypothetical protein